MALYLVIFIISFPVLDCMALKKNVFLTREDAFSDMLPKTGNANYIETKHCASRIQCAAVCVFCAGLLYNRITGSCHLLKARLSENCFDRSRKDTGWELYINFNGWYLSWKKHQSSIYIIDKQNNDFLNKSSLPYDLQFVNLDGSSTMLTVI